MLRPDAVALARDAAVRSCVLLKNDKMLPLAKLLKHIAIIGPMADDRKEMLGTWAAHGSPDDVITLAEGIKLKLSETEIEVVKGVQRSRNGAHPHAQ